MACVRFNEFLDVAVVLFLTGIEVYFEVVLFEILYSDHLFV